MIFPHCSHSSARSEDGGRFVRGGVNAVDIENAWLISGIMFVTDHDVPVSHDLTITPMREPSSTTRRRNHERSEQFKSHSLGV